VDLLASSGLGGVTLLSSSDTGLTDDRLLGVTSLLTYGRTSYWCGVVTGNWVASDGSTSNGSSMGVVASRGGDTGSSVGLSM
jgi:hypothetical protein